MRVLHFLIVYFQISACMMRSSLKHYSLEVWQAVPILAWYSNHCKHPDTTIQAIRAMDLSLHSMMHPAQLSIWQLLKHQLTSYWKLIHTRKSGLLIDCWTFNDRRNLCIIALCIIISVIAFNESTSIYFIQLLNLFCLEC